MKFYKVHWVATRCDTGESMVYADSLEDAKKRAEEGKDIGFRPSMTPAWRITDIFQINLYGDEEIT
ncbi:MAG: hypothetical protein JRC60_06350 [Deltaproteobacteria bacterium]|nr:hypothetical protein [Deltaproteobacteria bacterium]